jgi:hypothetical protein
VTTTLRVAVCRRFTSFHGLEMFSVAGYREGERGGEIERMLVIVGDLLVG